MALYESFLEAVTTEYDTLRVLKQSPRGTVSVVRHKKSGTRYVFRRYSGSGEVYRRLLPVLCQHLPQIMEAAEQDGQTAVLEEYVQGDTLAELLMGALLTEREARHVTMQLCQALHVLHSMGAVHRDVKPENVILRGSDAVLIDFDAARIYKVASESDTQVLDGLCRARAVRHLPVRRAGGHFFARRAAQYHAYRQAPLARDGGGENGTHRAQMHDDRAGAALSERASADGGAVR